MIFINFCLVLLSNTADYWPIPFAEYTSRQCVASYSIVPMAVQAKNNGSFCLSERENQTSFSSTLAERSLSDSYWQLKAY